MKLWTGLIIGISGSLAILLIFLIVPVLILEYSWWWFFAPLIFIIISWIFLGIILLVINFKKPKITKLKLNISDAVKRAVYEMKYDEDNPDNFRIDKKKLSREGEKGYEKTPILLLEGVGTEKNQKRVIIFNLNNPKQESTKLIDPSDNEIEKSIKDIAENPQEEDIKQETTIGVDSFGRPITTTKIVKPSSTERKMEEEQKKVDEANMI